MSKFAIRVEETLGRTLIVDAENLEEAIDQVSEAYKNCEIILTAEDFEDKDIHAAEWAKDGLVTKEDVSFYEHLYVSTRIDYLYRDACNYKKWNHVIVPGRYTEGQLVHRILNSCYIKLMLLLLH